MSWLKAMREKEPPESKNPIGTVVIGSLHPDMMDTAKEMVRKSLKAASFKTVDLGRGVSPTTFASKAKEVNAQIIVVTVTLDAAKKNLPSLMSAIESQGPKDKVVVMIEWCCCFQRRSGEDWRFIRKKQEKMRWP